MKSTAAKFLLYLTPLLSISPGVLAEALRTEVSVVAEVSVEQAWDNLQDFSVAHNYVPNLSKTQIVSTQLKGIGAHRRVYDDDGDYLEETIIEWQEGVGFVIKLHDGNEPMQPFDRAEFSYRLAPLSAAQTQIILAMTIEMPLGIVGEKMGEWVILPVIQDNLVQVAAGMKHYYETGSAATDEDRERLAGAVTITPAASDP